MALERGYFEAGRLLRQHSQIWYCLSTIATNEADSYALAILSHTWAKEEVTFRDMRKSKNRVSAEQKAGFVKIQQTCNLALQDGPKYAWVDSCCIDKSSSAELSEAINSMYMWYRNSAVCYTHLEDASGLKVDPRASAKDDFNSCRWFTRGWTLQELVASENLRFYSRDWKYIGAKDDLIERISTITGIHQSVLCNDGSAKGISIAQKMHWASRRITTRIEDQAYCLMGIFGVHMPLLYGEEPRAFHRRQLEIIKVSTDDSIFAFQRSSGLGGALAHQPSDFKASGEIKSGIRRRPYSITNIGLQIHGSTIGGDPNCSGKCAISAAGGTGCGHRACYFVLKSRSEADDGVLNRIGIRLQPIDLSQMIFARFAAVDLKAICVEDYANIECHADEITIVPSGMNEAKEIFVRDVSYRDYDFDLACSEKYDP